MTAESAAGSFVKFSLRIILFLFFTAAALLHGQTSSSAAGESEKNENSSKGPYTVKVSVEEMRLDVVVQDGNWKSITDLTADDFEIYQDNEPQKVLSSVFISNKAMQDAAPWLPGRKRIKNAPQISPVLEPEKVNRVIMFVVDTVDFVYLHYSRMALERFIEKQMQPGDLVSILWTGSGNSAFQVFVSDKQALRAKIDTLRFGYSRPRNDYAIYAGQLAMLRYGIRALRDMPGRKSIILITDNPTIPTNAMYKTVDEMFAGKDINYKFMFGKAFDRLADDSLRAKVVVHMLDIRGLEAAEMPHITVDELAKMSPEQLSSLPFKKFDSRSAEPLNPLPFKTGGTFVQNNNFFVDGIGEQVNNILQGYYLLSYAPPANTFDKDGKNRYHTIKVRVKRRGATVYARDGFFGVNDEEGPAKYAHPLQEAIFSPFLNKDLSVNLASGFLDDAKAGYVLRSWLQVDARDVTIEGKPGEGYFVKLQTMCLTTDIDGVVHDAQNMDYDFRIRPENLAWVREHGIRFSLILPVKNPGAYYVRAAVKDAASGKVGSAYQFIQIPDIKKKRPALSNIFVVNREEDVEWIKEGKAKDLTKTLLEPFLKRDERRSPAMKTYEAGENLRYMAVLYNPKHAKEKLPDLEVQSVLYKDGKEVYKNEYQPVNFAGMASYARIPIAQKLTLGSTLSKGNYVLELLVRDKNRKEKDGLLSQVMDFQIVDE